MSNIEFNLIEGRTAENVYKDTALLHGYKKTIKEVQTEEISVKDLTIDEITEFNFPENTISSRVEDDILYYVIETTVEIDNPVSEIDFGRQFVNETFRKQDASLSGKATEKRAKIEYSSM